MGPDLQSRLGNAASGTLDLSRLELRHFPKEEVKKSGIDLENITTIKLNDTLICDFPLDLFALFPRVTEIDLSRSGITKVSEYRGTVRMIYDECMIFEVPELVMGKEIKPSFKNCSKIIKLPEGYDKYDKRLSADVAMRVTMEVDYTFLEGSPTPSKRNRLVVSKGEDGSPSNGCKRLRFSGDGGSHSATSVVGELAKSKLSISP